MAVNKVSVFTNWESVADMIGSLEGIRQGLDKDAYMQRLIENAHGKATSVFDVAAASAAKAGRMTHMYEFGTIGITRGPVRHPDPTSARARLWTHQLTGAGKSMNVGFMFRPAVTRNPNHTTAHTGVPSKYLRRLSRRKYLFWNKASVVESGTPVSIKSKQPHGLLFIPFMGKPRSGATKHDIKRGYMMYPAAGQGPIEAIPGRTSKGSFTKFWMGWWESEGQALMDISMVSEARRDIVAAEVRAANSAKGHRVKPAKANNIVGAAAKSQQRESRTFGRGGRR